MSQPAEKPLNPRQKAFGRELGIAIASGDTNFEGAYLKAGYRRHRGNAARLADDPRVREIADEIAHEAVRRNGLHLAYLQAKALELLGVNAYRVHEQIHAARRSEVLTAEQQIDLDRATWPLSEFSVDKDGVVRIKVPDKKSIIEMLLKTMPGAMAPEKREHDISDRLAQVMSEIDGRTRGLPTSS